MTESNANSFLIKIDKIRNSCYASNIFLKEGDVIVALNNQFYIFGENKFTEELKELKKEGGKAILTVLRDTVFFDVIIESSLGCKFLTTSIEETEKIKKDFSSKENFDADQLNEYIGMRDAFRRYDVFSNSNSLSAGLFPPMWLAYNQRWWVLFFFGILGFLLLAVNPFIFLLGWLLTCIYCYKAQLNLLYSFSMLEGKVFCLKIAANSMDQAHETIRNLDPKSKFRYSKLLPPNIEEIDENTKKNKDKNPQENKDNQTNIVDENKEALV
tara:strand:+ start:295 stop:1104 length:810 start_codon:yes stop_codon:yes gene_type:complete